MWTLAFWKGAGERAIKTFFQAFGGFIGVTGVGTVLGFGGVNWGQAGSVALVAAILSLVTSIGNADFTAGVPRALPPAEPVVVDHSTPGGGAPLVGA
jgi:hypothetical protein